MEVNMVSISTSVHHLFLFYFLNIGDAGVPGAPGIPGYSYGRQIGVLLENLL